MKRKWELIADYCHKKGYGRAAFLAKEIDGKLDELYDMKITPDMEKDYEGYVLMLCSDSQAAMFANGMKCCVACVVHREQCSKCEFGIANGACSTPDPDALFNQFMAAFDAVRKD